MATSTAPTTLGSTAMDHTGSIKNEISIRSKLSRFAIGIGTYLVTCGAARRTRKLAALKKLTNKPEEADGNESDDQGHTREG